MFSNTVILPDGHRFNGHVKDANAKMCKNDGSDLGLAALIGCMLSRNPAEPRKVFLCFSVDSGISDWCHSSAVV